jgi:hypothetical protein
LGASQPVELWRRPIGAAGRPSPSVATFPLRLTVFNPNASIVASKRRACVRE